MPSRMDRYYRDTDNVKKRTSRNQDLYNTIYDDVEYTNVEGISIIEKNEKIDIDKIRELIGHTEVKPKPAAQLKEDYIPNVSDFEEKNYDIREILSKAKNERPEQEKSNTQYDILKGLKLNDNYNVPSSLTDEELKNMIETITSNSKLNQTGDLLDDLKTLHNNAMQATVKEKLEETKFNIDEIDQTFFTSSLGFSSNDFEDIKGIKQDVRQNNILTKVLIFILLVILITGSMFLIYHFIK